MATLHTPYADLLGLKVRVYRNLHNGLMSVQHRGRIIAHLPEVNLTTVTFTVQPAGRAKVLATKHKNVHAYVNGTVSEANSTSLPQRASYNPYRAATFCTVDGLPLLACASAHVTASGVWVS